MTVLEVLKKLQAHASDVEVFVNDDLGPLILDSLEVIDEGLLFSHRGDDDQ